MNKTKIEWVRNPDGTPGYSWNPITGCLNNCSYCYARKLANTRLRERYVTNSNVAPLCFDDSGEKIISTNRWQQVYDPFYPRFWPERLEELRPLGGLVCELVYPPKTRKGIFVCDMSDLFGIGVPEEWTRAVLDMIKKWPAHRFYLLTKQPQNLIKFSPFPDNCWVGVTTVGDFNSFSNTLGYLWGIKASVKYLSIEPFLYEPKVKNLWFQMKESGISWVIIGAQTKPTVMPKIEWVKEIVEACDKAGIPVFLKDNLKPLIADAREAKGLWRAEHLIRQEMPG